jgi:hypothetical protein
VNIDMSASTGAQYYFINCGGGSFTSGSQSSKGICTFNTTGTYWMLLQVQDINGNNDIVSAYAVATPVPPGPDTTPPTVNITSPAGGAHVSGDVTITATASDDSSGLKKVDFYRDADILIGTATASPYAFTWDSGTAATGGHSLYAKATDNAGNIGTSPTVSITVDPPTLPQVSIKSPVNGGTVPRHSTFTISASVTPKSYLVNKVEFLVASKVVCSIATNAVTQATYSCAWDVPAPANKSYVIQTNAYDRKLNKASSTTVTVTSK